MRVFYVLVLFLSLLLPSLGQSRPVIPGEKLGKLQINWPKLTPDQLKDYPYLATTQVSFTDSSRNTTEIIDGKIYRVAMGKGCLSFVLRSPFNYTYKLCGIEIKQRLQTTMNLSVISVDFNTDVLAVDFGEIPTVGLSGNTTIFQGSIDKLDFLNRPILVPPGTYTINFFNVELLKDKSLNFQAPPGQKTHFKPMLPDYRGSVVFKWVDLPRKFKPVDHSSIFLVYQYYSYGFQFPRNWDSASTKEIISRTNSGAFANWVSIPVQEITREFKAFPFPRERNYRHRVYVNQVKKELKIETGRIQEVKIATLDIHLLNDTEPGQWTITYGNKDTRVHPVIKSGSRYSLSTRSRFVTEKSIDVPFGFIYTVKAYLEDDLGRVSEQDSIDIDLRN